jgi:hypothetical protein
MEGDVVDGEEEQVKEILYFMSDVLALKMSKNKFKEIHTSATKYTPSIAALFMAKIAMLSVTSMFERLEVRTSITLFREELGKTDITVSVRRSCYSRLYVSSHNSWPSMLLGCYIPRSLHFRIRGTAMLMRNGKPSDSEPDHVQCH